MDYGMRTLSQAATTVEQYWQHVQGTLTDIENAGLDVGVGNTWTGTPAPLDQLRAEANYENIPGHNPDFDATNLHLHGMEVRPHLFYPMGTSNPSADWITVMPNSSLAADNKDQSCMCYSFDVPADNSQGLFWYHIHRHGAGAIQGWQGMVGLLQVQGPGSPEAVLDTVYNNGYDTVPVISTELSMMANKTFYDPRLAADVYVEGDFLAQGANGFSLFTDANAYQPTHTVSAGKVVYVPYLCAQITTGNALYFWDPVVNLPVPFYVIATDGISYVQPTLRTMLVDAPGNRQAILVQFEHPGRTYQLMIGILNDFQNAGEGVGLFSPVGPRSAKDSVLSYFYVQDNPLFQPPYSPLSSKMSEIGALHQPHLKQAIDETTLVKQQEVNFQVGTLRSSWIAEQFKINGRWYNIDNVWDEVPFETAQLWKLHSPMNYFHPFHVHVNPFMVRTIETDFLPGDYLRSVTVRENTIHDEFNEAHWQDTVFTPPYGNTTIWQRYSHWVGKTVFHCHFLDHEDQGMIANFMIHHNT